MKREKNYLKKEVYPFSRKDLKRLRKELKEKNKIVILSLLDIGVNTALRYSDLRNLRFEDICNDYSLKIVEKKTKKVKELKLNSVCLEAIENLKNYYKNKEMKYWDKGYIFKSQNRRYLRKGNEVDVPLTNNSFNRYLKKFTENIGIEYNIGSHSLRKTWGKLYYEKYKDIGAVMKILNHSSEETTLAYIGISRIRLYEIYENFKI